MKDNGQPTKDDRRLTRRQPRLAAAWRLYRALNCEGGGY